MFIVWGYVFFWGTLFIHELAHGLAAKAMGYPFVLVRIGTGPRITSFLCGSWAWQFNLVPFSGWCSCVPPPHDHSRLRHGIMIAAGPLADLAMLVGVLFLWVPVLSWLGVDRDTSWLSVAPACLYLLFMFCCSAYPSEVTIYGHRIANDGLQLWRVLSNKPVAGLTQKLDPQIVWFSILWVNKETKLANRYLIESETLSMELSPELKVLAAALLSDAGLPERARTLYSLAREHFEPGSDALVDCLDGWACLSVYHNRSDWLEEARSLIEEAIQLYPAKVTLLGTYGGILAELGKEAEAANHLHTLIEQSDAEIDQCISHAYLAWIAARQGDRELAAEHAIYVETVPGAHKLAKRKLDEMRFILSAKSGVND